MFIGITSDTRWGGSKELNDKLVHSINLISNLINDSEWQSTVNYTLRKETENQLVLAVCVRLFNASVITKHKIRSCYRYDKQKNRLGIDMIFPLEDYANLPQREIIERLSKDIFNYLNMVLPKYEERLIDFDIRKFLLVLKEKISGICKFCNDVES